MAPELKRADVLLVEQGVAESRAQAQRWIDEGKVAALSGRVSKASQKFAEHTEFTVARDERDRFVSRGGLKLAAALEKNRFPVAGCALDVGASTGGFADCLLQYGIQTVVCVDVGHDQMAEKIRCDQRVHNYEGINARTLPKELLQHAPEGFDLIVMDVSFISQTKILPGLPAFLRPGGWLVSLVKPQFEVGKNNIGKGGVVRNSALYQQVENDIKHCVRDSGFTLLDYFDSPIEGGDGNREFLLIAQRSL